ncbi:hypothetical protein GCM10023347_24450 [Streptomyces chumphonensis]|uniref:Uncharacterized protein n=1 Tax=Streptomyces chumphonensis TaxID=1214925 RepID=A0A927EVB8_9ACTN|nr:hypothetical protein [Streptomyces chumphonensis]MBD3930063.1 hypothetical protein [Streptomyces chumphonensis]
MTGDDRPPMPPVRLPAEAELARDALAVPLLNRAVALARWVGDGVRLTVGGELPEARVAEALDLLGLEATPEGREELADAWQVATETGLAAVLPAEDAADAGPADEAADDAATGEVAVTGESVKLLTAGGPADVLELWRDVWEVALSLAALRPMEGLLADALEDATGADGTLDPEALDPEALGGEAEESADLLDGALGNLYLLTATDPSLASGAMVPLPVLAASLVLPDDPDGPEQPSDAVLEEVSDVMMLLDGQLRGLEAAGAVEYRPMDEELLQEADEQPLPAQEVEDEELSRYGMVRLTPLGVHGERARLLEAGFTAPLVGDLKEADAAALLGAASGYPEELAQAELEQWLVGRPVPEAAQELLGAARGADALAPRRRLLCQQGLALVGAEAEPALRAVLSDAELGGLARVWLAERGARDVPPPDEELIFWLTVDTLAAQLDPEDPTAASPELSELMAGLVAQHSGFFEKAWRVDHPATARVLEAMARVHPDRTAAKAARKAAYKARSRRA